MPGLHFSSSLTLLDMTALSNTMQAKPSEFLNSGDSDASPDGTPSQFLLLRGLEPAVTEELLAKGVAKMYKPSGGSSPQTATASKKSGAKVASTTGDANLGAKDGSIRRVLLVRDRRNDESWRYGFAEFATVDVRDSDVLKVLLLIRIYRTPRPPWSDTTRLRSLPFPPSLSLRATSTQVYLYLFSILLQGPKGLPSAL